MADRFYTGPLGDEPKKADGSTPRETPVPGLGGRTIPGRTTPVGTPGATDAEASDRIKTIGQASNRIGKLLTQAYRNERGVHIETIVGAAAVLAGEFALRASVPRLPDTGWIAGGPADALMFRGGKPWTMWSMVQIAVLGTGIDISKLPNMDLIATRASSAIAAKSFPPKLSVPEQHYPAEFSPNAGPRFRGDILAIAQEFGLDPKETAYALALTLGILIKNGYGIVPIEILATLAAELMVAVTRIVPLQAPIR